MSVAKEPGCIRRGVSVLARLFTMTVVLQAAWEAADRCTGSFPLFVAK